MRFRRTARGRRAFRMPSAQLSGSVRRARASDDDYDSSSERYGSDASDDDVRLPRGLTSKHILASLSADKPNVVPPSHSPHNAAEPTRPEGVGKLPMLKTLRSSVGLLKAAVTIESTARTASLRAVHDQKEFLSARRREIHMANAIATGNYTGA